MCWFITINSSLELFNPFDKVINECPLVAGQRSELAGVRTTDAWTHVQVFASSGGISGVMKQLTKGTSPPGEPRCVSLIFFTSSHPLSTTSTLLWFGFRHKTYLVWFRKWLATFGFKQDPFFWVLIVYLTLPWLFWALSCVGKYFVLCHMLIVQFIYRYIESSCISAWANIAMTLQWTQPPHQSLASQSEFHRFSC